MGKMKKRLAVLLAAMLLLAALPTAALAADIQMAAGASGLAVNSTTQTVMFAGQEWYVIGYNGSGVYSQANTATLLLKSDGNPYGSTAFRTGQSSDPSDGTMTEYMGLWYANNPGESPGWTVPSEYRGSTLQQRMEAIADGFPTNEVAYINLRTLTSTDGIGGTEVAGQKLWPLSHDEWRAITNNMVRSFGNDFWLRSPDFDYFALVGVSGGGASSANAVNYAVPAARPAFSLNLSSVLFTSAAIGGKPAAAGNLSSAEPTTGAVKFTFEDAGQALTLTATTAQSTQSGGTLSFSYSGATTGANQHISCLLEVGNEVKYYGKLVDGPSAGGTLTIPLAGVDNGTYKLRVFSEQDNGQNNSDFCSTPVDMDLAVNGGTGTVSNFGGTILSNDAGLATVAGQTVTAGNEAGTSGAPKMAAINVANGVTQVTLGDIAATHAGATVELFSDSGYSQNKDQPIGLAECGATHLYVKVVSQDSDVTLHYDVTVTRAAPTYTYTVTAGNGGSVDGTPGGSYTQGTPVTATATANSGYAFSGWSANGITLPDITANPANFNMPAGAVTLTANFAPVPTYTITATAGTGGSISPSGSVVVNEGANQMFAITPNSGFRIKDVKVDGVSVGKGATHTFSNVRAAHSIAAEFEEAPTSSNPPASSTADYTTRTLRHEATGVEVRVHCASGAALVVSKNALHGGGTCAACDEIRTKGTPAALFDISITGGYEGNLEVRIPVGSSHNGQTLSIWHCKADHVEKLNSTAAGGYVSGTFSSLSPFAVFATGSSGSPQTGDGSSMGLWVALLVASLAALGAGVALFIRQRRKPGEDKG